MEVGNPKHRKAGGARPKLRGEGVYARLFSAGVGLEADVELAKLKRQHLIPNWCLRRKI